MHRILQLVAVLFLLTGCQSASLNELDYNTRLDFSGWSSWHWAQPDIEFFNPAQSSELDADRLHDAIAEELLQWGYLQRPEQPDFLVRARLGREDRTERIYYHHGSSWHDPWRRHYGPGWVESRDVQYQVVTLQLQLLDAKTGKLAWQASEAWPLNRSQSPQQRDASLRQAASKLLRQFPPR